VLDARCSGMMMMMMMMMTLKMVEDVGEGKRELFWGGEDEGDSFVGPFVALLLLV